MGHKILTQTQTVGLLKLGLPPVCLHTFSNYCLLISISVSCCFFQFVSNIAQAVWLLHFAWVVDDAKCIVVTLLCVSVCLCVCLSAAVRPHYCTDLDVTWGNGRECPLVVHYWSDLQSVHWFHCYDNRAPNKKCQQVLVLALCLVNNSLGKYFNQA